MKAKNFATGLRAGSLKLSNHWTKHMSDKDRIIDLQKSLRIAKEALERIAYGHAHNVQDCASSALDKMWKLEPKQPLQGLVGHERRR